MRTQITIFLLSLLSVLASAQTDATPTAVEGWADRLTRFGKAIPQEKVFVHLDNTCYFLGDTIWYAAYTRRTDTGRPSDISRVLYVELLNEEGYLVERQLVEMRGGRGHGNFVLPDTLYGGYYELRAYTRWQLNWGVTEKEHTAFAEDWFFSKTMAKEFYRDYEKLYSRVFPVYDKPAEPGEYFRDMTSRPLRRYFSSGAEEPQLCLSLFPEGGHLVAGVPCRIAFEAATEAGEAVEGKVLPPPSLSGRGQIPDEGISTVNRGRGVFTFTPEAGQDYEFTFTAKDGRTAKAKLSEAEADGVALSVERKGDEWKIQIHAVGEAAAKSLGLTIMHEGVVQKFEKAGNAEWATSHSDLPPGTNQATVFDADGRVWADRLFFVSKPENLQPSLTINGLKDEYGAFEQVSLQVTTPSLFGSTGGESSLSLSVRDAATTDPTYDTSTILTEMLLSSELHGYIPDPAYFFAADDEEHRTALDLLMMTQGWRRFDWHTMATPGAFALTQPAETQTPILRGEVLRYDASFLQDDIRAIDDQTPKPYELEEQILREQRDYDTMNGLRKGLTDSVPSTEEAYEGMGQGEVIESIIAETYAHEHGGFPAGSYRMLSDVARSRFNASSGAISREVRVHAEFTQPGSESIIGDVDTRKGQFTIPSPDFEGYCVFFLAASDTTKWKAGKPHTWIDIEDEKSKDAEFYVRISQPYPRFTQPYSYYQQNLPTEPVEYAAVSQQPQPQSTSFGSPSRDTQMQAVTVRARRGGLRSFANLKPAFTVDAYQAYNDACDAGLMCGQYRGRFHYINSLARLYVGDMNSNNAYLLEPRYNGHNVSKNFTAKQIDRFNQLTNLDTVRIYTDFQPRHGADPRATEDNIDRVSIDIHDLDNEGQRVTYRDRRYILQGFNSPDAFYSPHYSLPAGATPPADYRRTLYWNPDLKLDAEGKADVTFNTGARPAIVTITANGQAPDGTLLTTQ